LDPKIKLLEESIRRNIRNNISNYLIELKVPKSSQLSTIGGALKGFSSGIKAYYRPEAIGKRVLSGTSGGIPGAAKMLGKGLIGSKYGTTHGAGFLGTALKAGSLAVGGAFTAGLIGAVSGAARVSRMKKWLASRAKTSMQDNAASKEIRAGQSEASKRSAARVADLRRQDAEFDRRQIELRNRGIVQQKGDSDPYKLEGDPGTPSGPPIKPTQLDPSVIARKNAERSALKFKSYSIPYSEPKPQLLLRGQRVMSGGETFTIGDKALGVMGTRRRRPDAGTRLSPMVTPEVYRTMTRSSIPTGAAPSVSSASSLLGRLMSRFKK